MQNLHWICLYDTFRVIQQDAASNFYDFDMKILGVPHTTTFCDDARTYTVLSSPEQQGRTITDMFNYTDYPRAIDSGGLWESRY